MTATQSAPLEYTEVEGQIRTVFRRYRIGGVFVFESDNFDRMDTIREDYLKTRSDTKRKELSRQYEKLAAELNAEQPHQRYFKTLVI